MTVALPTCSDTGGFCCNLLAKPLPDPKSPGRVRVCSSGCTRATSLSVAKPRVTPGKEISQELLRHSATTGGSLAAFPNSRPSRTSSKGSSDEKPGWVWPQISTLCLTLTRPAAPRPQPSSKSHFSYPVISPKDKFRRKGRGGKPHHTTGTTHCV